MTWNARSYPTGAITRGMTEEMVIGESNFVKASVRAVKYLNTNGRDTESLIWGIGAII